MLCDGNILLVNIIICDHNDQLGLFYSRYYKSSDKYYNHLAHMPG